MRSESEVSSNPDAAERPPLFVHRWGTGGVPCVLIHGFGDGAYVWSDYARNLPTGYRAIAVDLRGHGHSPPSPDGLYFTHRHATDVIEMLDRLGLDRVVLIGHSLGADIALRIAIAEPERVSALVVVDFAPESSRTGLHVIHNLAQSVREYASAEEYLRWLVRIRPMASIELLKHCAAEALDGSAETGYRLRIDPKIFSLAHAPSNNASLDWALLSRIACPALLLRGANSSVLSRAAAEKMAAALPDAVLHEIGNCGHAVMLENPVAFRDHVNRFLSQMGERVGRSRSGAS